jgi:SAM-dependent methyltransferase
MVRESHTIRESYERIGPFFGLFGRLVESRARSMSLDLAAMPAGSTMLILAPPNEYFIKHLLRFNAVGESHLVFFSERMRRQALRRLGDRFAYETRVGEPDALPYCDAKFQRVFAYCYFDFLRDDQQEPAAAELCRILSPGGLLLTTYLAHPQCAIHRLSIIGLHLGGLSRGLAHIELRPVLEEVGFSQIEIVPCHQRGVPIELVKARKLAGESDRFFDEGE